MVMSSSIGKLLTLTTFGESHGAALGGILDGFPAGIKIDEDFIRSEMQRRRPGSTKLGTSRNEDDEIRILSGVFNGISTGTSIGFMIENKTQRSADYSAIAHTYRPGHADYTYDMKYGFRDFRGGGRSSGRETSMRVAGGAFAKLFLKEHGIRVDAGVIEVEGIKADFTTWNPPFPGPLCAPECKKKAEMEKAIEKAKADGDSVGGIIECHISGMIAGLGDPVFDKLDATLAHAVMSIGSVKGIEFGSGFESSRKRGSENNDEMKMENGKAVFLSHNAGGILGGISNGDDIVFRVAIKPTPSISKEQHTVTDKGEDTVLSVHGRHDPSILPRAVPVVEAMAALTIADHLLIERAYGRR